MSINLLKLNPLRLLAWQLLLASWLLTMSGVALGQEAGGTLADPPELDQLETRLPVEVIQITGNSLVSDEEFADLIARYEGRRLNFGELEALTQSIEQLYRDKGFLLVNAIVPTQESVRGVLQVQVIEGKIQNIVVEGNERYPSEFLASRFRNAVPAEGARTKDFQRALFLLNEMPDLQLKAVLSAGAEEGTTEVVLKAEEDRNYHFTTGFNNFGAVLTGEYRFGLGTEISSVFSPGDQILARGLLSTPSDNTLFLQAAYSIPVSPSGTRLGVQYANGAYTAGQDVAVLDIRGEASIYALTATQPLARSLKHSGDLDFRFSYNDLDNRILGQPLSRDKYTSASFGYRGQWRDSTGRFLGKASLTKGLGGTKQGDPLVSRLGASADFIRYNFDVARVQEFNSQWLAVLRGSMQFTGDPLFAAEQFAMGGPDTVRGFSQAEILGDQAYNATLELRWSPLKEQTDLFQTVFFVDHGAIVKLRPLPGEVANQKLTGAGLGFRVNFDQTRVRLDLGFPLSPSQNIRNNKPVVYGQVETRF
jgi:hemolysin activation/secretion protein